MYVETANHIERDQSYNERRQLLPRAAVKVIWYFRRKILLLFFRAVIITGIVGGRYYWYLRADILQHCATSIPSTNPPLDSLRLYVYLYIYTSIYILEVQARRRRVMKMSLKYEVTYMLKIVQMKFVMETAIQKCVNGTFGKL